MDESSKGTKGTGLTPLIQASTGGDVPPLPKSNSPNPELALSALASLSSMAEMALPKQEQPAVDVAMTPKDQEASDRPQSSPSSRSTRKRKLTAKAQQQHDSKRSKKRTPQRTQATTTRSGRTVRRSRKIEVAAEKPAPPKPNVDPASESSATQEEDILPPTTSRRRKKAPSSQNRSRNRGRSEHAALETLLSSALVGQPGGLKGRGRGRGWKSTTPKRKPASRKRKKGRGANAGAEPTPKPMLIDQTRNIDGSRVKMRSRATIGASSIKAILSSPEGEEALRRLKTALKSKKFRAFCRQEYFVSAIDRLYFAQNDFIECLYEHGLGKVTRVSRAEWSYVRSILGKPRRMSPAFFREERKKLGRYREDVRCIQQGLTIVCDDYPFPEEVPARLLEGQTVVAIHPSTHELHTGTVVSAGRSETKQRARKSKNSKLKSSQYYIDFDQDGLASAHVSDTMVMPYGHLHSSLSQLQHPVGPRFPHAAGDAHMVANLLRLLDRKEALLTHLRTMNDQVDKTKNEAKVAKEAEEKDSSLLAASGGSSGAKVKLELGSENKNQPEPTTSTATATTTTTAAATTSTTANANPQKQQDDTTNMAAATPTQQQNGTPTPNSARLPLAFKQQYAWVIVELEKASRSLDDALQAMRLRQSGISLGEAGSDLSVHVSQLCYQRARELMQTLRERMTRSGDLAFKSSGALPSKINNLIVCCMSLILLIQFCAERGLQPLGLDAVLESVRPTNPQNQKLFERIEKSVRQMQSMLSAV